MDTEQLHAGADPEDLATVATDGEAAAERATATPEPKPKRTRKPKPNADYGTVENNGANSGQASAEQARTAGPEVGP